MESIPSPFYTDPGIGHAAASLARAFLPNPARDARMAGIQANADFDRQRTADLQRQAAAFQAWSERARAGDLSPATMVQMAADAVLTGNPQAMQALAGWQRAFGGAAGADPNRMAQLQQGAGQDWITTEVGRRLQEENNLAQAFGVADRNNAGALARERLQQEGADRRMTVDLRPGEVAVIPPNSPVAGSATDGRIVGPPALPRATDAASRPAPAVPASIASRFTNIIANGVTLRTGGQATTVIPDAESQRWLARRAGELWQSGPEGVRGNPDAALDEAIAEFAAAAPPRTDWRWNPASSARVALPPTLRRPEEGPVRRDPGVSSDPPAPTEGAAPAPAPAAAVPPPAQRVRGQIYQTPRGPMVWTGTGWRPAA